MNLCLSCPPLRQNSFISQNEKKGVTWLTKLNRSSAVPPSMQNTKPIRQNQFPDHACCRVRATLPRSNTVILFWASTPAPMHAPITTPAKAYGVNMDYPNKGTAMVDEKGQVDIHCQSPQIYVEEGKTWPRHLHFVFATDDMQAWDKRQVYTMAVFPIHQLTYDVSSLHALKWYKRTEKPSTFLTAYDYHLMAPHTIAINALPMQYENLPYTNFHVPYDTKNVESYANKIGDQPYIVYCEHAKCNAAVTLIEKLVKAGAHNVYYFPGGREEFGLWQQLHVLLHIR